MSTLRATNIKGRSNGVAPAMPDGVVVTGVTTSTTFDGNLTGNVTGNVTGNATGLSGTPDVTVRNVTGVAGTFSGDLNVSGTLSYEDVTNIDSIGIVTARGGIRASGIITARTGTALTYHGDVNVTKAVERVSTGATSHFITDKSVTLNLDCSNGNVFTHSLSNGNVGIVSLTNFPAVENAVSTYTVIFTQVSSPAVFAPPELASPPSPPPPYPPGIPFA